jgi:hypothetical protein
MVAASAVGMSSATAVNASDCNASAPSGARLSLSLEMMRSLSSVLSTYRCEPGCSESARANVWTSYLVQLLQRFPFYAFEYIPFLIGSLISH